jgi:hypothetical protein
MPIAGARLTTRLQHVRRILRRWVDTKFNVPLRRRPQVGLAGAFFRLPLTLAFQVEDELAEVFNSGVGEDG